MKAICLAFALILSFAATVGAQTPPPVATPIPLNPGSYSLAFGPRGLTVNVGPCAPPKPGGCDTRTNRTLPG